VRRLSRLAAHLLIGTQTAARSQPAAAAGAARRQRPGAPPIRPTTHLSTALANFEDEGFCILKGVLDAAQVSMYRAHLLSVMGDLRYLNVDGKRLDPATARFTEPSVTPPREERSYTISAESQFDHANVGEGQRWHNGDFEGRYADELRLMIEGYVRHDPRWAVRFPNKHNLAISF
jgi:hypothetical protein